MGIVTQGISHSFVTQKKEILLTVQQNWVENTEKRFKTLEVNVPFDVLEDRKEPDKGHNNSESGNME